MFLCGLFLLCIFYVSDSNRFLLFIKLVCNFIIYTLIQEVSPYMIDLKV